MPGQLTPITQQDFSRGENTVSSPYLVRPDQVQQALNLLLDEHGSLRTRDGTLIQGGQSPWPARGLVKLFDLIQSNGVIVQLATVKGVLTVANNLLYRRDTTPWTFIGDLGAVEEIPDIIIFMDVAIIANGNTTALKQYSTLTSFASLPGPNAKHVANHLGYLWAWNTNSVSSVSSGPSSLQISDLNNQLSWPGAGQTNIARDDGQSGTGLALFTIAETGISPTATIIAFKDFSAYECTGILGTAVFAVQKVKSDMGCVAPRSIQFVSGFGIIRLTHRGFALYDGVNDTLISEEERPRIFGRDAYSGLDWTTIGRSMAAQVANPPLYICACPTLGSNGRLTRMFIYDLVRRAWTIANYPNDIGTMQLILAPNQLPAVVCGDANAGYVRRLFSGDTTDDGTVIDWALLTRAYTMGSATQRAFWLRLQAAFFSMTSGTQVTANFYLTPTSALGQITQTLTVSTVTQLTTFAGWGNDPWGTSPWGSSNVAVVSDAVVAWGIGVIANSVQVGLSSQGPMKLRTLELHGRKKALTRATSSVQ